MSISNLRKIRKIKVNRPDFGQAPQELFGVYEMDLKSLIKFGPVYEGRVKFNCNGTLRRRRWYRN